MSSTGTQEHEIFDQWTSHCLTLGTSSSSSKTKLSSSLLQSELHNAQSLAQDHFESILEEEEEEEQQQGENSQSQTSSQKQLAQLIASLGPALSPPSLSSSLSKHTKMYVRALALHYILGALQAFTPSSSSNDTTTTKTLPFQMMQLVSRFLLEHISPTTMQPWTTFGNIHNDHGNQEINADDDDGNGFDIPNEDVRDYAFRCIHTLLKIQLIDTTHSNSNGMEEDFGSMDKCIEFRIQLARNAIRKRCATLEDCDDYDDDEEEDSDNDDYEGMEVDHRNTTNGEDLESKILSNLSLLPRAKRSLCFQALESALVGMERDGILVQPTSSAPEEPSPYVGCSSKCIHEIVSFASFAAACLHGETDPRCLMQMLHLMHRLQTVLAPMVQQSKGKGKGKAFPYADVFDSVAVYYPVRFTPPPNDPHGITREGINHALMKVLTYSIDPYRGSGGGDADHDDYDDDDDDDGDETNMTVLATGLFLERISPPRPNDRYGEDEDEEDGNHQDVSTVQDRMEALGDLESLLLVPLDQNEKVQQRILSNLTVEIVKEMSDVLYRCHEEAAASVATGKGEGGGDVEQNKDLADRCRHFVTRISYELERQKLLYSNVARKKKDGSFWKSIKAVYSSSSSPSGSVSLWDVFVKDRIEKLAATISSSPQSLKGRMAIAYLASLSACGGEKTLRLCINACVPRLATLLDDHLRATDSNRDIEKMSTVVYGISVLFSSCRLSMEQIAKDGVHIHPHPLQPYGSRIIQTFCSIINDEAMLMEEADEDRKNDLEIASIKALQSVLLSSPAAILNTSEDGQDSDTIRETVLSLAKTLVSNIFSKDGKDASWKAACSRIVGSTIGKAIRGRRGGASSNQSDATLLDSDRDIIAFVETTLFPKMIESATTPSDVGETKRYDWMVLAYACETDQDYATASIVSEIHRALVNCLKEPAGSQTIHRAETCAKALSFVVRSGGPNTYKAFHSISQDDGASNDLIQLLTKNNANRNDENDMERISNLLLPETMDQYRSEAETAVKLSHTILPHILPVYKEMPVVKIEAMIVRASQVLPPLSDWDGAELCTILPVLSVALNSDAKLCVEIMEPLVGLTSDLVDYTLNREVPEGARSASASCLFAILAKYQVNSKECQGLNILKNQICPLVSKAIEDWTSSSAIEKMSSLEDAINIMAIIASSASQRGKISALTTDEVARFLVLISCEGAASAQNIGITNPLDCSEDALGKDQFEISMVAANALGSIFSVAPHLNPFAKQRLAHQVIPVVLSCTHPRIADMNGTELGRLTCASHVVCCMNDKAIGNQNFEKLTEIIVGGLEKASRILCTENKKSFMPEMVLQDLLFLLLGSLLKVHNQCPSMTIPHLGTIVPALLLINIISDGVSLNLMSMQFLVNLTESVDDGVTHFCKAYKPTILTHLAKSLDHPSSQVRQSAVQTRNVWSIID